MSEHEWELVADYDDDDYGDGRTLRLRVPGGWLYSLMRQRREPFGTEHAAMVFVPKLRPAGCKKAKIRRVSNPEVKG